jgi:TPR repeat protein
MPYAPIRILGIYLMALAAGVGSWLAVCTAATFELARRTDGTIIRGVKLEGEIVPGDAQKLLELYNAYGEMMSPIYLRSKGGNVEEAMKMGAMIRRLRLETKVPVWDAGSQPIDGIKIDHQENMICASACFLVYAGGARRFGNYLSLHRPFLPREEARKINDAEYEALQKQMLPKVKAYLADMEIDQYWIDRMFAASSQESYMPTLAEADSQLHRLMGFVPSLEEVVLSKCNQDPDFEKKLKELQSARKPLSDDDQQKSKLLLEDSNVFFQCQETVLSDIQRAAFERENDATLKEKCERLPSLTGSELLTLKVLLAKGTNVTPEEDQRRLQLFSKHDAKAQCGREEAYGLHFAAITRWSNEIKKSKHVTADTACADDFKAKGLSAEAMARGGKDAYDAENYVAAKNRFQRAAALGNAKAMMGMSWLYGNGHGVPKDENEALRWRRMSADNGNTDAMQSIGYAYEKGEGVPQDYAEALRWFKKAAERNDASAMMSIASLYENGRGVTKDYAEAMRWFRKAADLGDSFAAYSIGMHYLFAWGVPKDESKAREWIKKAAALGDSLANSWLIENP